MSFEIFLLLKAVGSLQGYPLTTLGGEVTKVQIFFDEHIVMSPICHNLILLIIYLIISLIIIYVYILMVMLSMNIEL